MLKKLFALVFISLIGANSFAAYAPVAPTVTVGNQVMTDLTNLIVLYCKSGITSGADWYGGCVKAGTNAAYSITSGKTFYLKSYKATCRNSNAASAGFFGLGSGTAGINYAVASAPAGATYPVADASGNDFDFRINELGANGLNSETSVIGITFASTRYPFIRAQNASSCQPDVILYGYEL